MSDRWQRWLHALTPISAMVWLLITNVAALGASALSTTSSMTMLAGATVPCAEETAALSVIVPVEPYVLIIDRITAGRADAVTLVPAGQSPHTYSPTPQQIAALTEADVLFRVGLELEQGLLPRLQKLHGDLLVVDLMSDEGEASEATLPGSHEHESGRDPHVWLNPRSVAQQAALIAETLTRLDPEGAEVYAAGLDSLEHDLMRLDSEVKSQLASRAGARFYVFHPAFGHFAEAYDLEQVAVETNGKEPSAKRLAELVDRARADGTRVIIAQPQHSDATIRILAREIDAEIVTVDPLAHDLFATVRALTDAITHDREVSHP